MDQNPDYNGLPSAEELQLLANTYFSEPPTEGLGISTQQATDPAIISNHLQTKEILSVRIRLTRSIRIQFPVI